MTNSEIQKLYRHACGFRCFPPDDDQFKGWRSKFSLYEERDLRAAIDEWFVTKSTMPLPADLLPVMQRLSDARAARDTTPRYMVAWCCPCCGYGKVGFLKATESAFRNCPSFYSPIGSKTCLPLGETCGATMDIRIDERQSLAWVERKTVASNPGREAMEDAG
jgi:hypothetical protein